MKHIRIALIACATALLTACEPQQPIASGPGAPESSGNVRASWFGAADSVTLDRDLLRRNFYVVLDGSGSMDDTIGRERKIDSAKKAINHFAGLVPADANLGLLAFDGNGITERVSLGTNNRPAFSAALANVGANSGTPLETAITRAYQRICAQAATQQGYGEYHLVIVTDGAANAGEDPTDIVNKILAESPVIIHTIGFGIGTGHSLNQPGRVFYQTAGDAQALTRGLEAVLAESEAF